QRGVYVSVVDQAGNPVTDLGTQDFVVREDKVTREILSVVPADDPMQIALLIDNSLAAEPYIRDFHLAITEFLKTVTSTAPGGRNDVAVITVAERPTINTEYTANQERLVKGVERIFAVAGSGSYMLDSIFQTSDGIIKRRASRPVIVGLVTTGPEVSNHSH